MNQLTRSPSNPVRLNWGRDPEAPTTWHAGRRTIGRWPRSLGIDGRNGWHRGGVEVILDPGSKACDLGGSTAP